MAKHLMTFMNLIQKNFDCFIMLIRYPKYNFMIIGETDITNNKETDDAKWSYL